MSVDKTPPSATIPPPLPLAPLYIEPSVCNICNVTMVDGDDCLIINECSHAFHRSCIEVYLSTSTECPVCKRSCRLSDLRRLVINVGTASSRPVTRSKGRGAMARPYSTRSTNRNLLQDSNQINPTGTTLQGVQQEVSQIGNDSLDSNRSNENLLNISLPITSQNPSHQNLPTSNNNTRGIDYEQINRMIEANISRLLQNLNIITTASNHSDQSNVLDKPNVDGTPRPNIQSNVNDNQPNPMETPLPNLQSNTDNPCFFHHLL